MGAGLGSLSGNDDVITEKESKKKKLNKMNKELNLK